VKPAWEKLHAFFAEPMKRKYYGISYPDKTGALVYMAATEETYDGEAAKYGCEKFMIKKGEYISMLIHDFMKDIPAIGLAFQQLIRHPGIDPAGVCVEIYEMPDDVRCMVKLK
jgi:hypothetical protein